ncbi:MAG: hypothetical protein WDW38_002862 [Sanguina aurantia]
MLASRQALAARTTVSISRPTCVVQSRASISKRVVLARAEVAGPVTDETFAELVLGSNVPVLVDFWAPWCGPCRMIAPIVDELANEYGDKLKCVKLNTDESPNVASEYGIRSIPTVMIFKGGKKMDTIIGAVPKATIAQTIDKYLN